MPINDYIPSIIYFITTTYRLQYTSVCMYYQPIACMPLHYTLNLCCCMLLLIIFQSIFIFCCYKTLYVSNGKCQMIIKYYFNTTTAYNTGVCTINLLHACPTLYAKFLLLICCCYCSYSTMVILTEHITLKLPGR